MNLRERLADWITGGALARAYAGWHSALLALHSARNIANADRASYREFRMSAALHQIAACETPNANATVRRMARIAREALE